MWRLAADENIRQGLLRGIVRRHPGIDILHVDNAGLKGADDQVVLAWAAQQNRVLLTHDIKTMIPLAYARIAAGQPMPGVIAIPWNAPVGRVIEDLTTLLGASEPAEWVNQVGRVPL